MTEAIYDDKGRWIAPPQPPIQERPGGPWNTNRAHEAATVRRKGA